MARPLQNTVRQFRHPRVLEKIAKEQRALKELREFYASCAEFR